jgi:hypothetical protein
MPAPGQRRPLEDRFWEKVRKTDGCWLWTGARRQKPDGTKTYGAITEMLGPNQYRSLGAHVVSWRIHFGPVPDGLEVCHSCNRFECVRPDHLYLGTSAQNSADAARDGLYARGRRHGSKKHPEALKRGEENGNAHLTEEDVRAIRASTGTQRELARQFGVTHKTIKMVRDRTTWGHLD